MLMMRYFTPSVARAQTPHDDRPETNGFRIAAATSEW